MTVEEAVCARVAALSGVVALVSSRVYLDKLPQGTPYPAVCVRLIDDGAGYHLRGPDGTTRARIQVDAYAQEGSAVDAYAQAGELAETIHGDGFGSSATGLSGWVGAIGSPALTVMGCFRVDRTRRFDAEELNVLTMSQDYMVWFKN